MDDEQGVWTRGARCAALAALFPLIVLFAAAGQPRAAAAAGASASHAIYWQPYEYDPRTEGLFRCGRDVSGVDIDPDGLLDDDATGFGALALTMPGAGSGADHRRLENSHPMAPPAPLHGRARQVAEGRLGPGLALSGPGDAMTFAGGDARGTTEFWIRLDAWPQREVTLLSRREDNGRIGLQVRLHPDGALGLHVQETDFGQGARRLVPGQWFHIAVSAQWVSPYSGSVRLDINGQVAIRKTPRWDHHVVNALARMRHLRIGDVSATIDEIRVSNAVRAFYPYDLDWAGSVTEPRGGLGQPFFRDARDLRLLVAFDQDLKPGVAPTGLVVEEKHFRIRGLGDSRQARGYDAGVHGDALVLGPDQPRPTYRAPGLMDSTAGTLAFWMRPLDWDNFERFVHQYEPNRVRRFTLFKVSGGKPAAIRRFGPMRGSDPSLLAFGFTITPDANRPKPPPLHPGRWTHMTVVWDGVDKTIFVDGEAVDEAVAQAGIEIATHGWYRDDNDKQVRADIFFGSEPEILAFEGADVHTLVDDFRVFDRALSRSEVRNLAGLYDPRREPAPLPAMEVELAYNGVLGAVDARAVLLMPEYAAITRLRGNLVEAGRGAVLAAADVPVGADGATRIGIRTEPFGFGDYAFTMAALDAAGAAVSEWSRTFTREPPPWWETDAGRVKTAMPEWGPMRAKPALGDAPDSGPVIHLSGREFHLAGSGLPAKVISAGADVLAGPVTLTAARGGRPLPLEPAGPAAITGASDARIDAAGRLRGPGFSVEVTQYTEFDGMMWYTLTLTPEAAAGGVMLDELTLRVPFRGENAELCHWSRGLQDFRDPRNNWIGALPADNGVLMRSNDGERWDGHPQLRGSFMPYVLLTGMKRGMAWFAENDRGWTQHDHVPAVSIEREDGVVTLMLRMLAGEVALDGPRRIEFGLHPIPVKPLDPDWRRAPGWDGVIPDTFSGNNLKGPDHTAFWLYPENGDWDAVRRRLDGEDATVRIVGRAQERNGQFRERYGREPRPREMSVAGLYWDMQWIGGAPPHSREWAARWHPDFTYYLPDFIDFSVWAWREWVRNTGKSVAGIYLDDCWPIPSILDGSPVSYKLSDGHVQPGWQWRAWRERMQRTRQVFYDEGIPPKLCAHTTHTHFVPYHSFFDFLLDGEDHYSRPASQADFIDHWPLERMRFAHPEKWGITTGWLDWTGGSTPTAEYPAWTFRQQRAYAASLALHDIGGPRLIEEGAGFIPYWEDSGLAAQAHGGLKISAWTLPGRCRVILVNVGEERIEAAVRLDPRVMGLGDDPGLIVPRQVDSALLSYFAFDVTTAKAPDAPDPDAPFLENRMAEAGAPMSLEENEAELPHEERRERDPDGTFEWKDGVLTCPVRRHDYRLFEFRLDGKDKF